MQPPSNIIQLQYKSRAFNLIRLIVELSAPQITLQYLAEHQALHSNKSTAVVTFDKSASAKCL